jgi:hypothetical protein
VDVLPENYAIHSRFERSLHEVPDNGHPFLQIRFSHEHQGKDKLASIPGFICPCDWIPRREFAVASGIILLGEEARGLDLKDPAPFGFTSRSRWIGQRQSAAYRDQLSQNNYCR